MGASASGQRSDLRCVYAGWYRQAYLASFLGGVIVSALAWTAAGVLRPPEVGFGVFLMVSFAMSVILPTVLAGYVVGRVIFAIAHGSGRGAKSDI